MAQTGIFEDAYDVIGTLGTGGFGVVYQAKQRTTGQLVAIKTLLPRAGGAHPEKVVARFLRETQLCAQLYHPNIVQLINAGETAAGQLYTVFVYAPGKSLSRVLEEEGALRPDEARHLMLQVLDALACAHSEGIVHRDLKPGNIMVVPTGARRNALVLDFGISMLVKDVGATPQERLTATAEMLGTPGYAAPEQLRGGESSAATDLFSWGLVFLECLTGKPVYRAATLHDMLYKQLGPEPIAIPPGLQHHALGKLLEAVTRKDPAARPQTATWLFKMLEACNVRGLSRDAITRDGAPALPDFIFSAMTLQGDEETERPSAPVELGERRQVMAVCCTLRMRAAASPLSSLEPKPALDIEEQNRSLVDLLGRCTKIITRYHGYLVATFGEQALYFFGYPYADEQDGKRAARAALAVREAMVAESKRHARRGSVVTAHIGIHAGLIIAPASPDSADATMTIGSTPRIAAQVAAGTLPHTIVVSSVAQRILRTAFAFEAHGTLDDPGEPLPLFRLLAEHSADPATVKVGTPQTALIGREPQIELLLQRWALARQGTGQASLVTGEPGIGKSRLADELCRRLAGDAPTVLSCRCAPDAQNSPLFPLLDLVERVLERETDVVETGKLARLERLLSRHGLDLAETLPLLSALLSVPLGDRYRPIDISSELQKKRTLEALRTLLFAMARARPSLLLFEDLHWADPTTIELLSRLIEGVSGAPLCIVLTARPEFAQTTLPATGVLQISLSRMGSEDVEALVAELFEGRELPDEVLQQIIKRTDGVPLFVEEFTQMLLAAGVLVLRGEGYVLDRPLTEADIPASLRDLLTSRLDRMGKAKETAQRAAAIGREFGFALLSAASDRTPEQLQIDLDQLQAAGLIQAKRKLGDRGYVFKHALIRDAAYESLSRGARRQIHTRLARTLEERFPHIVASRPDLLAQHHAAAEQKREAIRYAQKAAKAGLARSAYVEAAGQVTQALPWLEALDDARERTTAELELSSIMMPALMAMGGAGDSRLEALTAHILALSDALGSSPHRFPTLYALTTYHHIHSNRAKALELAQRLVALAEDAGDLAAELAGHAILAQCLIMAGRHDEARAAAERSLALYDPSQHRDMVLTYGVDLKTFAHSMRGEALAFLGYLDQAAAEAERALAWARELGLPNMVARSLFFAAFVHRVSRDRERTLQVTHEAIAIADRYGLRFSRIWGGLFRGWANNDPVEIARFLDANKAAGQVVCMPLLLSGLAEAEAAHGRTEQALDHLEAALRFSGEHADYEYLSGVLRLKGMLSLARDAAALDLAEACHREAIKVARTQCAKTEELDATVELARVLARQGRIQDAHQQLSEIYGWFTEGFESVPLREAHSLIEDLAHRM
ncbi:MAG: TOMM system kinase/cyclase fusion protein [Myxococcales bacterium]|nr:TOMM system kinase/cyclase fusion protein [Myxococcales bacterium]